MKLLKFLKFKPNKKQAEILKKIEEGKEVVMINRYVDRRHDFIIDFMNATQGKK